MENKTNGMENEIGCQCGTAESFKEKMIRKVLESKALQTVLDFIVGGKAINADNDATIGISADFDSIEATEKYEYNAEGKKTSAIISLNGKMKMSININGKGSYSLDRK